MSPPQDKVFASGAGDLDQSSPSPSGVRPDHTPTASVETLKQPLPLLGLMLRDTHLFGDEALNQQQRKLRKAASNCRWAFRNLILRRQRNRVERRRALVLHAVNITLRFLQMGEAYSAIEELNVLIEFLPAAVLLHAARACALQLAGHKDGQAVLLRYAGQRFCSVRWENMIFYILHRIGKSQSVHRIMSDAETSLDCLQPSKAELQRIRLRIRELAAADFENKTAQNQTEAAPTGSTLKFGLQTGTSPPSQRSDADSLPKCSKPFGLTDIKVFDVEPTLSSTVTEAKLRIAARNWRRTYALHFTDDDYREKRSKNILRIAAVVRRLIRNGNVDAAICELDASLGCFPCSALLAAVRACAGLIGDRPSGPEVLCQYRGQTANDIPWEHFVFDQLDRLRKAPGISNRVVTQAEKMLGCKKPSVVARKEIRRAVQAAAGANFATAAYAMEMEKLAKEWETFKREAQAVHLDAPSRCVEFLALDVCALTGDYIFALHHYFQTLEQYLVPRKRQSMKRAKEASRAKTHIFYQVANISLRLLQCGNFEVVLSTTRRALCVYPGSATFHACRAAALIFLNRTEEARAIYRQIIADGTEEIIEQTFKSLHAGGRTHPLIDEISAGFRSETG